jgi:hypothetical protein
MEAAKISESCMGTMNQNEDEDENEDEERFMRGSRFV